MSDAGEREWRFYIDDMIAFAEKVIRYTADLDQRSFVSNGLIFDATLRNLELIGEAAMHVPERVRSASPRVPWRLIVATRNRLIHGYLGIEAPARAYRALPSVRSNSGRLRARC